MDAAVFHSLSSLGGSRKRSAPGSETVSPLPQACQGIGGAAKRKISTSMMETEDFNTFKKQLGRALQAKRKRCGLSQEKAGEAIGMDRVSIGYIEQGKRAPKLSTLYALSLVCTAFPFLSCFPMTSLSSDSMPLRRFLVPYRSTQPSSPEQNGNNFRGIAGTKKASASG